MTLESLTGRRAAWLAAALAGLVYLHAVANGWAGDDPLVVARNWRAHSIQAALSAWFLPYWPPPWQAAGLYRPLTILSYGVEWTLSAGRPWLFHLDNVLLHALASGMVVLVARRWLPPLGALVAGAFFAVHPVHVEAVANVVGRAELLAAVTMLGMVLAARRYRHTDSDTSARRWLFLTLGLLAVGLFSKENAVIAIAVVALDHVLDGRPARRSSWDLYLAVAAVTIAWLHIWRAIAGDYVNSGSTTAFYGLSRWQRISTMMPVQLEVVRLLAWPLELSADYSPYTIPLRPQWGALATLGLTVVVAVLGLGLLAARRAPAVAFGILLAAGSYAPTSNLLFPSGVVLAERVLYLAVLAPALVFGWLAVTVPQRPQYRRAWAAVVLLAVVFAGRTVTRVPLWKSATHMIIEEGLDHPENYRGRVHLGDLYAANRDTARALAEYLAAGALAPNDPFSVQFVVRAAMSLKRPRMAIVEARRVHAVAPWDPRPGGWLAEAFVAMGQPDSAVAVGLADALRHPDEAGFIRTYRWALGRAGAAPWRLHLIQAREEWILGRLVQASAQLDSAAARLSSERRAPPTLCDDFRVAGAAVRRLNPSLLGQVTALLAASGAADCLLP